MVKENSYGAKIKLTIEFEGNMKELCDVISKSLSIPEFWFDTISEPPYETIGYCETFGFEIDIQKDSVMADSYIFSAVTTDTFKEINEDRMHNLSIWFSSYFKLVSKLKIRISD